MTNETDMVTGLMTNATDAFTREYSHGEELVEQAWAWFAENSISFLANLIAAALIFLVGIVVVKGLTALTRKALHRMDHVDALLEKFLTSVVSKVGWAILLVVVLQKIGVNVAPLVAGLGVTGFILGFAFKESLGNLASGLMIALNRPFAVGDYVVAGGVEGTVLELNMMATVIATADNKKIVVANTAVWNAPIKNFSALATRRVDFAVGIAYGADIARAKEVLLAAAGTLKNVLPDPAPMAEVVSLDDSSVGLSIRVWCPNAKYWEVFFAGYPLFKAALDKAAIEIPFPQMDVHVNKGSDL